MSGCRASAIPEAQRYPAGTPFRAQYRTIDGTRLRLIDTGNGTPVVLIHGFGASMYGWRYQLPPLVAAGYRVVVIDNRGFGFSDKPAHGYTNAAYAHLVVSLLDSLGIASAVLVGHSMGGAIAAEVALAHPDRVRGMVLLDAAGYGVRWPGVLKLARWPQVGAVVTRFRARWITARILRSTFADPGKVTETDVDQYYAPVPDPAYGRAVRGVLREFRFDSLGGRLGRVQAPTLILWGDADRWIPIRDGTRFARELPRSEFVVLQRTGHDAADESPDQVNRLLLDYLKEGLTRIPENVAWSSPSLQRSERAGSGGAGRRAVDFVNQTVDGIAACHLNLVMTEQYELWRPPATSLPSVASPARASSRSRGGQASTSNCCSTTTTPSAASSRRYSLSPPASWKPRWRN